MIKLTYQCKEAIEKFFMKLKLKKTNKTKLHEIGCFNCEKKFNWLSISSGAPFQYESIIYDSYENKAFILCYDCVNVRKKFNTNKIYNYMILTGWNLNDAKLAIDAVKKMDISIIRKEKLEQLNNVK